MGYYVAFGVEYVEELLDGSRSYLEVLLLNFLLFFACLKVLRQ